MPPVPDEAASPTASQAYGRLAAASPAERTELVLRLIEGGRQGRLELPARDGQPALLEGVGLGAAALRGRLDPAAEAPWWSAETQGVRLQGADLRGAVLSLAD